MEFRFGKMNSNGIPVWKSLRFLYKNSYRILNGIPYGLPTEEYEAGLRRFFSVGIPIEFRFGNGIPMEFRFGIPECIRNSYGIPTEKFFPLGIIYVTMVICAHTS